MNKGRFIVVEGGDASGKSTLVASLVKSLQEDGLQVAQTREPGGSPTADRIRAMVLSDGFADAPPRTMAFLMMAARSAHVHETIQSALGREDVVICDRWLLSTRAYQGKLGGVPDPDILALQELAAGDIKPDLTILLDIDVNTAAARLTARSGASGDRNHFDELNLSKKAILRQSFLEMAHQDPKVVVIDASQAAETVLRAALAAVAKILPQESRPAPEDPTLG